MRDEDLPPVQDLLKRHRAILAPSVDGRHVVDEDDKVVELALVVHLGEVVVSARHDGWRTSFLADDRLSEYNLLSE